MGEVMCDEFVVWRKINIWKGFAKIKCKLSENGRNLSDSVPDGAPNLLHRSQRTEVDTVVFLGGTTRLQEN